MPQIILDDLEQMVFTLESMVKLREKITLSVKDMPIVAQDDRGNEYCYGDEGFPRKRPKADARAWLGVEPDSPVLELEWEEM